MVDSDGTGQRVDGRAARWAGHRAKRRAEIVSAALRAVQENGPAVSMEQIAAQAGIARPQLYRHFADADELYRVTAQGAAEMLIATMAAVLARPAETAYGMINNAVRTFVVWLSDHVSLYRYVALRSIDAAAHGESLIVDVRMTIAGMLRDVFAAYLALFEAGSGMADPLAFAVVGMVESTTARWATDPGTLTREDLIMQLSEWVWAILDNVLRGIGVVLAPDTPLPELETWPIDVPGTLP